MGVYVRLFGGMGPRKEEIAGQARDEEEAEPVSMARHGHCPSVAPSGVGVRAPSVAVGPGEGPMGTFSRVFLAHRYSEWTSGHGRGQ